MKPYRIANTVLILLISLSTYAQTSSSCDHCTMVINNDKFVATALDQTDTLLKFDAIECLINFQKKHKDIHTFKVTDYNSGAFIDAQTAYYLKSKSRPSPMGAYLSAYTSKEEALNVSSGSVMSWTALLDQFESSNFGAVEHSHHNHHRADAHGPIGIMGDHLHPKGGFMMSVRVMQMKMEGNRRGTDEITDAEIYQEFRVAPQAMTMQMYMLGIMYAPSDKLTLMLMQNFGVNNMNLTAQMMMPNGMTMLRDFETKSSGIGDLQLSALYSLWSSLNTSAHLNAGINIPIGDIENKDDTPMMNDAKLPYAMQLGSGTFDFTLGATIKGNNEAISWGIQQLNTIRTGRNSEEYRFGNLYKLNLWGAYSFIPELSTSLRLQGTSEGTITGFDSELNPMMVTTADPNNYGGEILRTYVGINTLLANGRISLGFEIGIPFYQNYNAIFMDEKVQGNLGVRYRIL